MIPVIFINSKSVPFVDTIVNHQKIFETRTRNVFRSLIGKRVLIAETGNGKPLVKCSARLRSPITIQTAEAWNAYKAFHSVPTGSVYDWQQDTKKKLLYELHDVIPFSVPFHLKEGKRHGRIWMEYNGRAE